jgi:hypothetical protein
VSTHSSSESEATLAWSTSSIGSAPEYEGKERLGRPTREDVDVNRDRPPRLQVSSLTTHPSLCRTPVVLRARWRTRTRSGVGTERSWSSGVELVSPSSASSVTSRIGSFTPARLLRASIAQARPQHTVGPRRSNRPSEMSYAPLAEMVRGELVQDRPLCRTRGPACVRSLASETVCGTTRPS